MADVNLPYLPQELIEEILLRTPVTCLVRFRRVSRSWCELLSTDFGFIKMHLMKSLENADEYPDYLLYYRLFNDYYLVPDGDFYDPLMIDTSYFEQTDLVGSCNGLVCLAPRPEIFHNDRLPIKIWNPATRRYKTLPLPEIIPSEDYGVCLEFCFDPTVDDYKVFRACPFSDKHIEVEVYSLHTNSWRRLGAFPYFLFPESQRAVMDGVIFWGGNHGTDNIFILSFDVANETFGQISMPPNAVSQLLVVRGCLTLIVELPEPNYEILQWVNKSWTRLFIVKVEEGIESLIDILSNGDLLFIAPDGWLGYYDFETGETEEFHFDQHGLETSVDVVCYVESLAQL